MNVLFLNSKKKQCGVYQYGLRLFDILKNDKEISYFYDEVENYEEYKNVCEKINNLKIIIYNYHDATMPWINNENIKHIKSIGIPHESGRFFFDYIINITDNFPRPIFENIDETLLNYTFSNKNIEEFINYKDNDTPIFGSFGFGFLNKGFDRIIDWIHNDYDNAIIKFVIPVADFSGCDKYELINNIRNICFRQNRKPGIKLMITHEFFSNEDLLYFLKTNTVNIFLYDRMEGRGLSSVIDYAISVKKPLVISDSFMFRHFYDDKICCYKTNIQECINNSVEYCKKYLEEWSNEKLRERVRRVILSMV